MFEKLKDELQAAYDTVIDLTEAMFEAAENKMLATVSLGKKENELINLGKIDGKNQQIRDAQMFAETESERQLLMACNDEAQVAGQALEIAKLKLACLRDIIRVYELLKS